MKKYFLILFAFTALAFTSCASFNVKSDYAETVNFTKYKTYKLRINDLKLNDIDKDRVLNSVSKELKMRGLTVNQNPDLIVNIKASHKKIKSINNAYGVDAFGGFYGWGFGVRRTFGRNTTTHHEGALIIDLVDAKTQKLVWQGTGSGISVDSPRAKRSEIPKMIAKIMENYPPKK